jgi:gamma-glutamyltranspeptidase
MQLLFLPFILFQTIKRKEAGSAGYSLKFNSNLMFRGSNGMVSSAGKYATQIGVEILKNGGNAVDAAVAIGFALADISAGRKYRRGGFMVIRTKDTITSIDFREKAPSGSTRNMFLDASEILFLKKPARIFIMRRSRLCCRFIVCAR